MKRRFEVQLEVSVTLEIDDTVTSDSFPGETVLTAHNNTERFREGSLQGDALHSLAVSLGMDRRRLSSVDGWADFSDEAAQALGWPETTLLHAFEVIER